MAIVKQAIRQCKKPLLLAGTVIMLFFIYATTFQDLIFKDYNELKTQDALTDYLNLAFDQIDEAPVLANKADSIVAKIWRSPITDEEKLAYYHLLTNIAYHLLQSGQIQASTRWYEQAYAFYRQEKTNGTLVQEMEVEEYVCKPLGNNYTRIGDFSKAILIQQTAIALAIENGKYEMLPALYANMATTYLNMQEYEVVQEICNKGISALQQNDGTAVLLYNLKAQAYLEMQQKDSARLWNEKALRFNSSNINNNWIVTSLIDRAHILTVEDKQSEALGYLLKAWSQNDLLATRERAKVANEIGICLLSLHRFVESKDWFSQALNNFKLDTLGLYPDYTVTASMFGLAKCYEQLHDIDSTSYWYEQAVLNDYYTQQLIDTWLFSEGSIYFNETNTEQAIAWNHSLYDATKKEAYLIKALWLAELSKGRKLMYEQQRTRQWQSDSSVTTYLFEALREDYFLLAQTTDEEQKMLIKKRIAEKEYQLSLKGNVFAQSLSAPSYQKFVDWLNEIRRDNTVISYYSGNRSLYIVSVSKEDVSHTVDTTSSFADIYDFVNTYFYEGPTAFNNNPYAYAKASHALLQKYLPGIGITNNTSLIVSPAGALHLLPLEALCLSENTFTYLGLQQAVSYQYSLLQLLNAHSDEVCAVINAFAFEKPHLGFPALPSSKDEVDFLAKHFKTQKYAAAKTANKVFYDALNSNDIIHLASHAVADDNTHQPYIVLKEKLYLGQIQFNTARCPLMVLAACETGKGTMIQHEGMQSLGRSLLSKGVGGVLSSRWAVDDAATKTLIQHFYKELEKVKTPAQALKNARIAYLKNHTHVAAQNPWLWAAFYYQGVNQPIILQSKIPYGYIVIAVAMLLVGLFFIRQKKFLKRG